jgi:hypothetical protein
VIALAKVWDSMIKREQERCVDSVERAASAFCVKKSKRSHDLKPLKRTQNTLYYPLPKLQEKADWAHRICFTSGSTPARHYGSFSPVSGNFPHQHKKTILISI